MKALALAGAVMLSGTLSARQESAVDITDILHRAGERVAEYFARAQSIICLEKVSLQRLGMSFGADGPPRFVESELRLSWEPTPENPIPTEAKTLRQVLRVNGSKPRKNDYNNCTTPEQNDVEEQPLSMLLSQQREKYTFSFDRRENVEARSAVVIAFQEVRRPAVDVSLVEDNEDCVSFNIEGGMRGRIWIDTETFDVLRLDQSLSGLVEIPLPRKALRVGSNPSWTMERFDTSIKFKRVAFENPEETLVLPISSSKLQITRGAGTPRLRTSTQYLSYRRFMTGSRIVPQQ
jgi:hypothetical protein